MSADGISALERGHRRRPFRETLALLAGALALDDEQRREFESAVVRRTSPRRRGSVTVGPWTDDGSAPLPFALTSFVGRETELGEIAALLREHRLVTIIGAGGVGKTQTALRVAEELDDADNGTVRFVDFAPIRDQSLVVSAIASALSIQEVPDRPLLATVIAYLKNRTTLLILDNCEHVIAEAADLVTALLSECQQVRILATSREPFNAAGDYAYHLPSLDDSSAIALFHDRAQAVDRRFAPTEDNAAIVAEICRRLDGIPLAIELAAARVKHLSLRTLSEKLDDRFCVLIGGERTAFPRQQTMRATIEWSYDLLTPPEQLLFARLGILAGGFILDAVTAVCAGAGLDETKMFDLLALLIDKSLVVADTGGPQERYRLLESTAAYALEKLDALGEREGLDRRHAEYFRDQAGDADARYGSYSTVAWLGGVQPELDNYRAALAWALPRGSHPMLGGTIAGALEPLWRQADLSVEGRYWIELALPLVSETEQPAIAARLHLALSGLSDGKRRYEAAERAMRLYQTVGDLRGAARAQRALGFALFLMGRHEEAHELIADAVLTLRECRDMWNAAHGLNSLAYIEISQGDLAAARELFEQALVIMKALEDGLGISLVLGSTAELEFAAGNPERALRLASEALKLLSLTSLSGDAASWHNNSSVYHIALGDLRAARDAARNGLQIARQLRQQLRLSNALQQLALVAALGDDARRGVQLLGYVDAQYCLHVYKRQPTEQWSYEKLLTALRESLNEDEVKQLAVEGAGWSEDRAVEEALKI